MVVESIEKEDQLKGDLKKYNRSREGEVVYGGELIIFLI